MRSRPGAQPDPSEVEDRRDSFMPLPQVSTWGAGGLVYKGAAAGFGFMLTFAIVVVFLLTHGFGVHNGLTIGGKSDDLAAHCQAGGYANAPQDCRIVGVVDSVQAYWAEAIPKYTKTKLVLFDDRTRTKCGLATRAIGPFYCAIDDKVYLDLGFFNDLERKFGARGGPFAQAYVVAHEFGHRVQDVLGTLGPSSSGSTDATSHATLIELQADCYAGVWARHAKKTGFIRDLTDDDIAQGLDAAAAVGHDHLHEQQAGHVAPDTFTHGTSAQRVGWFKRGLSTGDRAQCDTFHSAR